MRHRTEEDTTPEVNEEGESICDYCAEPIIPASNAHTCVYCGMVTCDAHDAPIDHECEEVSDG